MEDVLIYSIPTVIALSITMSVLGVIVAILGHIRFYNGTTRERTFILFKFGLIGFTFLIWIIPCLVYLIYIWISNLILDK